jgi:hypothetical protein
MRKSCISGKEWVVDVLHAFEAGLGRVEMLSYWVDSFVSR